MINFLKYIDEAIGFLKIAKSKNVICIYSEGNYLWKHFAPLIKELIKRKVVVAYLCSEEFKYTKPKKNIYNFHIPKGQILNWVFNNLETKLLITSTPDIDTFGLQRGKNISSLMYLHHSFISHHMGYRCNAFNSFDSILCVNKEHIDEIRKIENYYDLKPKKLIKYGYSYFDNEKINKLQKPSKAKSGKVRVLIAPSWGQNSITETLLLDLVRYLISANYLVVYRPHPESTRNKSTNIDLVKDKYITNKSFIFDSTTDSDLVYRSSDILITDYSGTAFEFSFGFLKPVIFIDLPPKINNTKFKDIENIPNEIKYRKIIGEVLLPKDIEKVSKLVKDVLVKDFNLKDKRKLFYNFGNAAKKNISKIIKISNND